LGFILVLFFVNKEVFINLLGTDFFLRIDRLLDWSSGSGFQLENGMLSIGSGWLSGIGLGNTPLYFPESQTDFIFAIFASSFGFIG
ncbi:FtsW/RodA/SpoVE family cell cycle protein, partial [Klebsiella pneumoniae]|uniref:FtsW/RodA/SpoVE family cell cycle protein n=1 Tax=Klebsiella pneumoniae TaxID=573 RepID=UPI002731BD89